MYINKKGIALIVALIIAFIILALGSLTLYISMQSTKISGSFRQYRSAVESAEGAFNETREILGSIKAGENVSFPSTLINNKTTCLHYKLNTQTSNWTDNDLSNNQCSNLSNVESTNISDIVSFYDLKYSLGGYTIYIKLVNTAKGNTSSSSSKGLVSGGVTSPNKEGTNVIHPPPIPFLYRMEIVAESTINTKDKAHISLLYGY